MVTLVSVGEALANVSARAHRDARRVKCIFCLWQGFYLALLDRCETQAAPRCSSRAEESTALSYCVSLAESRLEVELVLWVVHVNAMNYLNGTN